MNSKSLEKSNSFEKSKSVSSLLNFPRPPSEMKDYNTLARDGTNLDSSSNVFYVNGKCESFKRYFREQFDMAEALARTSLMTSPAAKRRIAARKKEIDHGLSRDYEFEPPRDLLLYLVR
uniref:Uncharacterized protein n=1 Tax=Megaselia scalaris TaxID=36166 RepID=T1GUF9_MEGSC